MGAGGGSSTGFQDAVKALCATRPGGAWSESFGPGHGVRKVGGRTFAAMGALDPGASVETPDVETASVPIDAGLGLRARCFHRFWVRLPEGVDAAEPSHRIEASHDIARAGLTRGARAALPPRRAR